MGGKGVLCASTWQALLRRSAREPLRQGTKVQLSLMCRAEPGEELTFKGLMVALGSASEAAMMWRDVRETSGVGVKARPRTWFVLPREDNA